MDIRSTSLCRTHSITVTKPLQRGKFSFICTYFLGSDNCARLIFSMYTVGQIAGSLFAGQIADHFGRRAGMFTGCFIIIIGTTVIASSNHMNQFIAGKPNYTLITVHIRSYVITLGRFILGMGIAVAITAAPAYIIEVHAFMDNARGLFSPSSIMSPDCPASVAWTNDSSV